MRLIPRFRRTPTLAAQFAAAMEGPHRVTVLQPTVDQQLVDRVAKLTAEVRELHEAVDRLTSGSCT